VADELDAQTEQAIRALEDGYQKAMIDVDLAWFDANWAPDLLYVHTSGRTDARDRFVDLIRTGEHKHTRRETGDVRIRRYGDTVVVTGSQSSEYSNKGAPPQPFESRFTRVYVRREGRWMCVSSQSGRNAPPS
jgi:ketosteroid isomerase-like protein